MENQVDKTAKSKKMIIFLIIGLVVLAFLLLVTNLDKLNKKETTKSPVINGDFQIDINDPAYDASTPFESNDENSIEIDEIGPVTVIVPGANAINKDNIVITANGEAANNVGIKGGEGVPLQTGFLNPEELPESVFQLKVGSNAFTPNQFTTIAGSPTTFSLTSTDDLVHTLVFEDRSLSSIVILVGPGQTKAITFNAPQEPGIYNFKCISPGHEDRGEVGQLIVK